MKPLSCESGGCVQKYFQVKEILVFCFAIVGKEKRISSGRNLAGSQIWFVCVDRETLQAQAVYRILIDPNS